MTKKKLTKIVQGQLAALNKRLASGKPLTAAQMAFVERFDSTGAKDTGADESDTAASLSALARRLGVSRQLIAWHRSRAAAPKDLSVSAWRIYLLTHGKGGTIGRVESSATDGGDSYDQIMFGAGLLAGHGSGMNGVAEILEVALESAGVEATTEQRDKMAICLWLLSANGVHRVAVRNGCPHSPLIDAQFDPRVGPEDHDWCPPEIRAAANRINFHLDSAREIFCRHDPQQGFTVP